MTDTPNRLEIQEEQRKTNAMKRLVHKNKENIKPKKIH